MARAKPAIEVRVPQSLTAGRSDDSLPIPFMFASRQTAVLFTDQSLLPFWTLKITSSCWGLMTSLLRPDS